MLSGLLSAETLSQALRDISQRRRQGVLEVTRDGGRVDVMFIQGRAVDVARSGRAGGLDVYDLLVAAGFAAPGLELSEEELSYAALLSKVTGQARGERLIDENLFRVVLKERVLAELYSLWSGKDGFFSFSARMVDGDRELFPSISVGQLLLDVVEIEPAAARFKAQIPGGAVIERGEVSSQTFSPEEELLNALVGERCRLEDLQGMGVLSSYHLHEALLSLVDRGVLKVGTARAADRHGDIDALMAALEKTVDSVFEPLPDDASAIDDEPIVLDSSHPKAEPATGAEAQIESALCPERQDESGAAASSGGLVALLYSANSALLQACWVPNLMTVLLVAFALLAPFVFWFEGVMKLAELNP